MADVPEAIAEGIDIVLLCAENGYNYHVTERVYEEKFPNRRPVSYRKISRIMARFRRTGTVQKGKPPGRPRTATNMDTAVDVINAFRGNPHTSTRAVARQLGGRSHMSVHRILKRSKFHPYHVHLHQALHPGDEQKRVAFCNWLDACLDDTPEFCSNVLWSDEASFARDGNVNLHNAHYWAVMNPHWIREATHQVQFRVNVWCGVYHNTIVGPVFLPPTMTAVHYLQHLRTCVSDFIDDQPLASVQRLWFQQDGAPIHYGTSVRDHLNASFPNQWIGRGGPVAWPPRSPDLTPLDFFLWGFVKDRVYATEPTSIDDLQQRIRAACLAITPDMLQNVRACVRTRIRTCIAVEGGHFEHLLDLN